MDSKAIFSDEYKTGQSTDAKLVTEDTGDLPLKNKAENLRKKIEEEYKLSKPNRKIIKAKVIQE